MRSNRISRQEAEHILGKKTAVIISKKEKGTEDISAKTGEGRRTRLGGG